MANTTFDGPVRSRNGFQSIGPGAVPALTIATDLTVADHAGRLLTMDPQFTPTAITIPAIVTGADASTAGPGSDPNNPSTIGTTFEILFIDDFTGTIKTASTADKFVGMVTLGIDASVSGKQFVPATANNEMNLNGEAGAAVATTGGLKGTYVKFTAIAANLYYVEGLLNSTGSIATPFDTQ
jgi:3-keto-L-gulonate-6-phosphate decarboxylase|tara:strand:+ start:89 stop:634 length:546 start_codon:yes stop_codon:yes gene_type:complete